MIGLEPAQVSRLGHECGKRGFVIDQQQLWQCHFLPALHTGSSYERIIQAYGPVKRAKPDFNLITLIVPL